ncbi:unnamed protein product [Calypogeia fissa]
MVAAFGSGAIFSVVSGMGGPNVVGNAVATGAFFALLQGGIYKVGTTFSQPPTEDKLYAEGKKMLNSLGLQKYEKNFKKGLLTDTTLPLLNDSPEFSHSMVNFTVFGFRLPTNTRNGVCFIVAGLQVELVVQDHDDHILLPDLDGKLDKSNETKNISSKVGDHVKLKDVTKKTSVAYGRIDAIGGSGAMFHEKVIELGFVRIMIEKVYVPEYELPFPDLNGDPPQEFVKDAISNWCLWAEDSISV